MHWNTRKDFPAFIFFQMFQVCLTSCLYSILNRELIIDFRSNDSLGFPDVDFKRRGRIECKLPELFLHLNGASLAEWLIENWVGTKTRERGIDTRIPVGAEILLPGDLWYPRGRIPGQVAKREVAVRFWLTGSPHSHLRGDCYSSRVRIRIPYIINNGWRKICFLFKGLWAKGDQRFTTQVSCFTYSVLIRSLANL